MTDDSSRSGAPPDPPDRTHFEDLPWKPLDGVEDDWEVAHRGAGRYLLRDPEGKVVNGLDHLWTLEVCRAEIEVEKTLKPRTDRERTSPLGRLHAIRREWLRWSVDRLQEEAADVLGREEPVEVENLSRVQLLRLIGEWEPIFAEGQ